MGQLLKQVLLGCVLLLALTEQAISGSSGAEAGTSLGNGKSEAGNATLTAQRKLDVETPAPAPVKKKKVVIVQFDVANTAHVDDISNIYDGLPSLLSKRMEASGEFLPAYVGHAISRETEALRRDAVIQIAGETGTQFLIHGAVVTAGIIHQKGIFGRTIRHIEIELSVYDGVTGSRLLLHRFEEQAKGNVIIGNDKPFGSSIFFETESGKAINRLVDSAVKDIRAELENVPFSTTIVRVEGRKVFLDAGSDSLLDSSDKLVAYAGNTPSSITGLNGSTLGTREQAVDIVTLIQVQPQFSIGELTDDAEKLGIKTGGNARIDATDLHYLEAKQISAQQAVRAQQEAARVKAEQAVQAETARVKMEQALLAEAARIKEEKKAEAKAKAQAAAEAKAAKLKNRQVAKTNRVSAAQKARARAQAVKNRAAQKAKAAAEAKIKDDQIKADQKLQTKTDTDAETKGQQTDEAKTAAPASAPGATESIKKHPLIKLPHAK